MALIKDYFASLGQTDAAHKSAAEGAAESKPARSEFDTLMFTGAARPQASDRISTVRCADTARGARARVRCGAWPVTAFKEFGVVTDSVITELRMACRLEVAHSIGDFQRKMQIRTYVSQRRPPLRGGPPVHRIFLHGEALPRFVVASG